MITHNLIQGSPEWHQYRANHFNASDAPAMMGESPYMTRTELLTQLKTGVAKEFDTFTKKRFEDGHRFEALAREVAENIIGEELYPVTGSDGKYSASFDGLTLDERIGYEHKSLNNDLRNADYSEGGHSLPLVYRIQMEQQLMVSRAEKILFMASKWDENGNLIDKFHCFYLPDNELRNQIINGWDQFAVDLETFVPKTIEEKPQAEVVLELPALFVHATGEITTHNMKEYGAALEARLAEIRAIALVTDQDFANAKAAAKMLRDNIVQAKAAKEAMLEQTISVGEASRMIDAWCENMRVTALQLEKDVEREDLAKKNVMVLDAKRKFSEICFEYAVIVNDAPLQNAYDMPNFAEAIKGKRNYASMQDAIDTLLAQATIDVKSKAQDYSEKFAWFHKTVAVQSIFPDLSTLIFKPMDDFKAAVELRQKKHQEEAEAKAQEVQSKPEAIAAAPKQEADIHQIKQASRPTALMMISVIADHYKVNKGVAQDWLTSTDFTALEPAA